MVNRCKVISSLIIVVFITTFGAPAFAGDPPTLVGTWDVRSTVDGAESVFWSLFTFNKEGTSIASGSVNYFSNAHGVWEKTGPKTFTSTTFAFVYDENGMIVSTMKNLGELEVSKDKQSFTGEYRTEVRLLDGTLVNSFTGVTIGTRIRVEPF